MNSPILDGLFDLLFPPKCPFCHKLLGRDERLLCAVCQQELPWAAGAAGWQKLEFMEGCVSPLHYRDKVPDGILRFKFRNCCGYAEVFGQLMAQAVRDQWPDLPFDAVTWVPLSRWRLRRRGYDQARLLAEELGSRLSLPVEPTLRKIRHTTAQSGLSGEGARRANALGAYRPAPAAVLSGRSFLLVDDVVTTGATLSECARILRTGDAERVYAVTVARAGK